MATATATAKTTSKSRSSRRSWRGWMTVTDLIAAACSVWVAIGAWQETHSVGECLLRVGLIYGAVHAFAPMARGGKS